MEQNHLHRLGWFFEPRTWWLRHLLFWLYRYSDAILGEMGMVDDTGIEIKKFIALHLLPDLILVYAHLLLLVPSLLLKKRVWAYIAAASATILLYASYTFWYDPCLDCEVSPLTVFFSYDILDGAQLVAQVAGLRIIIEFMYSQGRMSDLQNANLQTELAYLRNQVSPHFLFNVLNNITVLADKYPDKVTPAIIQLSKVLRYQLYESEKDRVLLSHEIENLRNYAALEAMRQNKATVEIQVDGSPNGASVAPLLFLPFLENALKHGVNAKGESQILARFGISGKKLYFTVENARPASAPLHAEGGIGLKNICRRLELLYPKKHQLEITETTHTFKINLELELS